jgi:hypothetical protein
MASDELTPTPLDPEQPAEIAGVPDSDHLDEPPDYGPEVYGTPMGIDPRKGRAEPRGRSGLRIPWPIFLALGCLCMPFVCCIMVLCGTAAAGATLATIFSRNHMSESHTETLSVPSGAPVTLNVDNRVGEITIERGTEDTVVVEYTKTAYGLTKSNAQDAVNDIIVDIQQPTESEVTIDVQLGREEDTFFFRGSSVDLTLTVPERVALTVQNNVGTIKIQNLRVQSLDLETNTGSIEYLGWMPTNVNVPLEISANVGTIRLTLPENTYLNIDAEVDVGDINVSDSFDQVTPESQSGDSVGARWQGTLGRGAEDAPTLNLKVNVGDIRIAPR